MAKLALGALALGLASLVSSAALAQVEERGRFYASFFGGSNFAFDQTSTATEIFAGPASQTVEVDFDGNFFGGNFVVGGNLGYVLLDRDWGRIRVEGEVTFRQNELGDFSFNGGDQFFDGDVSAISGFGNVFYDTPVFGEGLPLSKGFRVLVGGGAGIGRLNSSITYFAPTGAGFQIPTRDSSFAWQAGIGYEWILANWLSLVTEARYFSITSPDLQRLSFPGGVLQSNLASEFDAVSLTTGFRLKF